MVIVLVFGLVACLPIDNKPTNINHNNSLKGDDGDSGTKGDYGTIVIAFPTDDSVLEIGNGYRISWESRDVEYVDINLYGVNIDNKELLVMNIATGIENTGQYAWEISPDFLAEEGLNFMEDRFKLVISDSNGNATDSVSDFVITYPINYETEDKNLKGRGGKEDIPNSRTVDMVNNRFVDGGVHTLKWNTGSKYIENVNIYLYKNGEYYQTIAKNVPNRGEYEWTVNILPNRSEIGGQPPIIEDSQVLSNALTNILPSEISYMNDFLGLDDVYNIVVLSGDLWERIKFAADSIPKPYWRGTRLYKIARALIEDTPNNFTEDEKKNMAITLSYYLAKKGLDTLDTVRKSLDIKFNGTKAIAPWDFNGHDLDMDGDGDVDYDDMTISPNPFHNCVSVNQILMVLEYIDLFNPLTLTFLVNALESLGLTLSEDSTNGNIIFSGNGQTVVIMGPNLQIGPNGQIIVSTTDSNGNSIGYQPISIEYDGVIGPEMGTTVHTKVNFTPKYGIKIDANGVMHDYLIVDKEMNGWFGSDGSDGSNPDEAYNWVSVYTLNSSSGGLDPFNNATIITAGNINYHFLGGGHNYIVVAYNSYQEPILSADDDMNGIPDGLE